MWHLHIKSHANLIYREENTHIDNDVNKETDRQKDRQTDRQADRKSLIAFLILNINLNLEHGMLSLEFLIIEQALKN